VLVCVSVTAGVFVRVCVRVIVCVWVCVFVHVRVHEHELSVCTRPCVCLCAYVLICVHSKATTKYQIHNALIIPGYQPTQCSSFQENNQNNAHHFRITTNAMLIISG